MLELDRFVINQGYNGYSRYHFCTYLLAVEDRVRFQSSSGFNQDRTAFQVACFSQLYRGLVTCFVRLHRNSVVHFVRLGVLKIEINFKRHHFSLDCRNGTYNISLENS